LEAQATDEGLHCRSCFDRGVPPSSPAHLKSFVDTVEYHTGQRPHQESFLVRGPDRLIRVAALNHLLNVRQTSSTPHADAPTSPRGSVPSVPHRRIHPLARHGAQVDVLDLILVRVRLLPPKKTRNESLETFQYKKSHDRTEVKDMWRFVHGLTCCRMLCGRLLSSGGGDGIS
jgi:hypothetical protein